MLHERAKARMFEVEAGVEPLVWAVGGAPLGDAAGRALLGGLELSPLRFGWQ